MTDPLLTIEDATREYRVSPKTIRRRLTAGELDGAYKRPGARGPEWVVPRSALDAAGFVKRNASPTGDVPAEDGARADYWSRRALDAEAALQLTSRAGSSGSDLRADVDDSPSATAPSGSTASAGSRRALPRSPRAPLTTTLAVLGLLVVGLVAGLLVGRADGGEDSERSDGDGASGTHAVLAALTDAGDTIGVVGDVEDAALPVGREVRLIDGDPFVEGRAESVLGRTRFVVAGVQDPEQALVRAFRRSAKLVLELPRPGGALVVFDVGRTGPGTGGSADAGASPAQPRPAQQSSSQPSPTESPGALSAPSASAPQDPPPASSPDDRGGIGTSDTAATSGLAADAPPEAEPVAGGDGSTDAGGPVQGAGSTRPTTITVSPGASFWTIAVELAGAEFGSAPSDADVLTVWTSLLEANADRLVTPGNPDLLHVGQSLVVPASQ